MPYMVEQIISYQAPQHLCSQGSGAEIINGEPKTTNYFLPKKLILNQTQYVVGFCTFFDSGFCKNPYGKNQKGECFFPKKGLPMFNNQNEASEALVQRYKELQEIADGRKSA